MTTATQFAERTDDEIAFQLELCADKLRCFLQMYTQEVTEHPCQEDGHVKLSTEVLSKVFALDYAIKKVIQDVIFEANILAVRK